MCFHFVKNRAYLSIFVDKSRKKNPARGGTNHDRTAARSERTARNPAFHRENARRKGPFLYG